MFKKNLGDNGFELIDILVGFDSAERQMQVRCMSGPHIISLRCQALPIMKLTNNDHLCLIDTYFESVALLVVIYRTCLFFRDWWRA